MTQGSALRVRHDTEQRVSKFLYHLGKGLWSSVPVLGPLVKELFYDQFKDELTKSVSRLSDADIERIAAAIPAVDPNRVDALETASARVQEFAVRELSAVLSTLTAMQSDVQQRFDGIESRLDAPISIGTLVEDIRTALSESVATNIAVDRIEQRRQQWIERISGNQRRFLGQLPEAFTPVDDLWPVCQSLIPSCTYKEFRFRLHELEWLGLVERKRHDDSWLYRKTAARSSATDAAK